MKSVLTTTAPSAPASAGVFLSTLSAMNKGLVLTELDDALREVTKAALDAGKKAKLTLDLTVVPSGNGIGGTPLFAVVNAVKTSLPKPPQDASVFFADDEHNLTRRNPLQEEMTLTLVKAELPGAAGQGVAKARAAAGE